MPRASSLTASVAEVAAPQIESGRALLVVAPARFGAADLGGALGMGVYEAGLWARHPAPRAWRWLPRPQAEEEASRLRAQGLEAEALDEGVLRRLEQPAPALSGGELSDGGLQLGLAAGSVSVAGADICLAVTGPIVREAQIDPVEHERAGYKALRRTTPRLEPGSRFHLHPVRQEPPLEIDPSAFEFAVRECGRAPRLSVQRWIERLACPRDDTFRHLTPVLAPRPQEHLGLLQALRSSSTPERPELDNLSQFRSYSAWRAQFERQRRH